jgi:hypothetical protein
MDNAIVAAFCFGLSGGILFTMAIYNYAWRSRG